MRTEQVLQEVRDPRFPVTYFLVFSEVSSQFSSVILPTWCVVEREDGAKLQRVFPFPSFDMADGFLSSRLNFVEV